MARFLNIQEAPGNSLVGETDVPSLRLVVGTSGRICIAFVYLALTFLGTIMIVCHTRDVRPTKSVDVINESAPEGSRTDKELT